MKLKTADTNATVALKERQKEGFNASELKSVADNLSGLIGSIMQGGNDVPQEVWNSLFCALNQQKFVAGLPYATTPNFPPCVSGTAPSVG